MFRKLGIVLWLFPLSLCAQINTERVMMIARNALYFEDYVLSIQYFNQVINAKPYLYEPYFFRGLAKFNLDDFQGAESDCDKSIERNPFVVGAYQIRGLARINQQKYEGAVEDYRKALTFAPENITLWNNLTLCHMQMKDYDAAQEDLKALIEIAPNFTRAYLMRGEVYMMQKDTVNALKDFDYVTRTDKYDPDGWSARGIVRLQQGDYAGAEDDLSKSIYLNIHNASNYINRALARFHQNNLRGAMSDYDLALDVDPNNFIGHYNRGLLRARVGDTNRAIEDFDFVLKIDPNDMMATFNRGLLRSDVGDYKGAHQDFTTVLDIYPKFQAGYYYRSELRKKMGNRRGAEEDDYKLMKLQLDEHNRRVAGNSGKGSAQADSNNETSEQEKTRKQSDRNVNNYRRIVIADEYDRTRKYKSDYRGRVQNKNVNVKLQPMFALTYYQKHDEVKRQVNFHVFIDQLNRSGVLPKPLLITNMETPLTEEQVKCHFSLVDEHTSDIVGDEHSAQKRFARGLDFYLVQDFDSSIEDFTKAILTDGTFYPAYFMRSLVRCKQLEYRKANATADGNSLNEENMVRPIDYDVVIADLNKVIQLAPDFEYAFYNRGNLAIAQKNYQAALLDYNEAIRLRPDFADAYYNRGLTHIFLGNNKQGIADLSKAGELGIVSAYNVIKRFTDYND